MSERGGFRVKLFALLVVLAALIASGIHPHDRLTWWMEVAPVLVVVPILIATHKRFPLTGLLYALVAVHALVLIIGGAYTYARVPAPTPVCPVWKSAGSFASAIAS